jgi:hypothetical protein
MTEPDAGPSNEEPDVMTTTAEVHPARIVAEIRANDGRQPGPREAEDGEDAPRDSGADGDESPSSPSPTLAPLADDERSSGGSLGDDEDDDIDDIRPESDSPGFEFPGTSAPAASTSAPSILPVAKTGEKLGSLEHLTVLAANATNELANLRRELNAERTRVAQYSTELRMLRRSTKEMGETAHAKAKLATDSIQHALKARNAAESTLVQMKNEVEAAKVANELVRAAEDRAIAAEARANDAENRATEADAIAEKALEVSLFLFSYGQLL